MALLFRVWRRGRVWKEGWEIGAWTGAWTGWIPAWRWSADGRCLYLCFSCIGAWVFLIKKSYQLHVISHFKSHPFYYVISELGIPVWPSCERWGRGTAGKRLCAIWPARSKLSAKLAYIHFIAHSQRESTKKKPPQPHTKPNFQIW